MSGARPVTRRALGAMLGTAAVAARAQAPAGAPAKPAGESNEAEAAMQRNSEALAKVDVPRDTEPAFKFQA